MFNLNDYQTCAQRLELFWKDNPQGRVETKLLHHTETRYIVWSAIYRTSDDVHPWATGLAEETVAGRGVNQTSALENCETSSLARALANAGYSPKGDSSKRASREEMEKVQRQQQVSNLVNETKEKLKQSSGEYVPVPNPDDPWAIVPTKQGQTAAEAVDVLASQLGAEMIQPPMRKCKCGTDMIWATGTMKTGKPWGHYKCKNVPSRKCMEPIWFTQDAHGWKEQTR